MHVGEVVAEQLRHISVREAQGPPCGHVLELLDRHAADLDARIGELTHTRTEVQHLRNRAVALDPSDCASGGVCHVIPTG
ncbi:MAG: hypothetical protein NVS3B26_13840 [Mycobacteriales bacterium]